MEWKEVQETCETRIRELVKKRENNTVRDLVVWSSNVKSNEEMRKLSIESRGERYGGKYLKIEVRQQGFTTYHIVGTEHKEART